MGWEFGMERQGEEKGREGAGKKDFGTLKLRRAQQLTLMGELLDATELGVISLSCLILIPTLHRHYHPHFYS